MPVSRYYHIIAIATIYTLALLWLSGCGLMNEIQDRLIERLNTVDPPKTQAEAAATEVAVITVARWDDYAKAIQPAFTISSADALGQAIPATAAYQSRLVDAVRLGLTAGLPTTGTTETETRATDATGAHTTTSQSETRTAPGQAPPLPAPLGTVIGAGAQQLPGAALGEDPFLKYSIAADLYQEVQILNRALADAKVRDAIEPYLLRLKVAVMPYRRGLSYDAYSDLFFFLRDIPTNPGGNPLVIAKPVTPMVPAVVPLLVTDNLETATDAASAQFVAEAVAAISGAAQGAVLGAQLQSLGDRMTAAAANERNALRTVGRLGENAIRVRLGSTLQAGPTGRKDYELLPRTHTISLLVLVPRTAIRASTPPQLAVVARTVLKDARTGEQLDASRTETFKKGIDDIVHYFNIQKRYDAGGSRCVSTKDGQPKNPGAWLDELRYRYVIYGDYAAFYEKAKCLFTDGRSLMYPTEIEKDDSWHADVEDLWIALLQFTGDYATTAQTVDLPEVREAQLPDYHFTVIMTDDGKTGTVAHLTGGLDLVSGRLGAELDVPRGHDLSERIAAEEVKFDGAAVIAMFPSLDQIRVAKDGKLPPGSSILLTHRAGERDDLRGDKKEKRYLSLRYVRGENVRPTPGEVAADIAASRVVAREGEGKLTVGLRLKPGVPPRAAYVRVGGAEIEAVSGGELDEFGRLKASASGRYTLGLRNLAPGGKVAITVGLIDGTKEAPTAAALLDIVEATINPAAKTR